MKDKLKEFLRVSDYEGIKGIFKGKNRASLLRRLISLTYDKQDVLAGRAVRAIGEVSALMDEESARMLVERILWMMRDESGGSPWSGPEIIGEVVRVHNEHLQDIVPVLASFNEEEFFRAGVRRALLRIFEVRPDLKHS